MAYHSGKLRNMASVYLLRGNEILLLFRQGDSIVKNLWIGSAGGHFEKDEIHDAKQCVLRELKEELNLEPENLDALQLRYITLRYTDGEVRQNYYFFANVSNSVFPDPVSTEGQCQWFGLKEISALPMPITARQMIDHYLSAGQYTDLLYAGISKGNDIIFQPL